MKKRIDMLRRLANLQKQVVDIKKSNLARVESKQQRLLTAQADALAATEGTLLSHGSLAVVASRHIRMLDNSLAAAAEERRSAGRELVDHTVQMTTIEKMVETAMQRQRDRSQREELEAVIESWQAAIPSRSGQA